jgi:hypothetical protein
LEKEGKATAKGRSGRLERILLKDKVGLVLGKGSTPAAGKWNNTDLKVMIQWFKRDGDNAMPKKKEGLLLRYRKTHTCVVDGTTTYPREDVEAAVALVVATVVTIIHSATNGTTHSTHATASTTHSAPDPACTARSSSATAAQDDLNKFDLAAAGNLAVPHDSPVNSMTDTNDSATGTTAAAAIVPVVIAEAAGDIVAPAVVAPPHPLLN